MTNSSAKIKNYDLASTQLAERLDALHRSMLALRDGGRSMSNATKGLEREIVVSSLLEGVFPPSMRFGSGDVVDGYGHRSGQLDVVLEYPNSMSFPVVEGAPRLYLAENVAAAIEVKSDLPKQWKQEVCRTGVHLAAVERQYAHEFWVHALERCKMGVASWKKFGEAEIEKQLHRFDKPAVPIPLFIVAFDGWARPETLVKRLSDPGCENIAGVLTLEPELRYTFRDEVRSGPFALLCFLSNLQNRFSWRREQMGSEINSYVKDDLKLFMHSMRAADISPT